MLLDWRAARLACWALPLLLPRGLRGQGKFDAELIATANKIATPGKGILVGVCARPGDARRLASSRNSD